LTAQKGDVCHCPSQICPLVAFNYGTPTDGLLFDKNDPMTTLLFGTHLTAS
jgi:hypothetical protein